MSTQLDTYTLADEAAELAGLLKLEKLRWEELQEATNEPALALEQVREEVATARAELHQRMQLHGVPRIDHEAVQVVRKQVSRVQVTDEAEVLAALEELGVADQYTTTTVKLKLAEVKRFGELRELPGVTRVTADELQVKLR